jgi:hypothetical protein
MKLSANCQGAKQFSANLPTQSNQKISTWHEEPIDNNKEKIVSANLPTKPRGNYVEKIFIVEKRPLTLETPSGRVRLKTGEMFRGLSSDPTVKKMVKAGMLRKATPKEVIDDFVKEAKEVFKVQE